MRTTSASDNFRPLKTALAAASLAAGLAGCAAAAPPNAAPDPPPDTQASAADPTDKEARIKRGRWLAATHCASCHALRPGAKSRHPEAPALPRLSEEYPVSQLQEAFAEGILVGHPDMPEFHLVPNDIDALLDYLVSIQLRREG